MGERAANNFGTATKMRLVVRFVGRRGQQVASPKASCLGHRVAERSGRGALESVQAVRQGTRGQTRLPTVGSPRRQNVADAGSFEMCVRKPVKATDSLEAWPLT